VPEGVKFCARCGGRARCTDSRQFPRYVRRRYACNAADCAHRWTTAEFVIDDEDEPHVRDRVERFRQRMGKQALEGALEKLNTMVRESFK
jgi:hypothetical protein